jgi:ATP-dependent RNA helicase DHX37/DHR1
MPQVGKFPFPLPPEAAALRSAAACLLALGALEPAPPRRAGAAAAAAAADAASGKLTELGRLMAVFPISPRHSRMLLQLAVWRARGTAAAAKAAAAVQQPLSSQDRRLLVGAGPLSGVTPAAAAAALPYAVALAAVQSLESPFMQIDGLQQQQQDKEGGEQQQQQQQQHQKDKGADTDANDAARAERRAAAAAHASMRSPHGDALSALNALCLYEAAAADGRADQMCSASYLHGRQLREMSQLRQQLGRSLLQLRAQATALAAGHDSSLGPAHLPGLAGSGSSSSSSSGSWASATSLLLALLEPLDDAAGQALMTEPLPLPPASVVTVLRRAIAAGWCDQVRWQPVGALSAV